MADKNINKANIMSLSDIKTLLSTSKLPDSWVTGGKKITYEFLASLFKIADDLSLSSSCVLTSLNLLLSYDVSSVVKQISNFKKKVLNSLKKDPTISDKVVEILYDIHSAEKGKDTLGPYCSSLGISLELFFNLTVSQQDNNACKTPVILNNGAILELDIQRGGKGASWTSFLEWLTFMLPEDFTENSDALKFCVNQVKDHRVKLLKSKKTQKELETFLSSSFVYPKKKYLSSSPCADQSFSQQVQNLSTSSDAEQSFDIEKLLQKVNDLEEKLSFTCQCLSEEINDKADSESNLEALKTELSVISKERDNLRKELTKKISKLSNLSPRNVNKRISRQIHKHEVLKSELSKTTTTLNETENQNQQLQEQLENALKEGVRQRKKTSYWKKRCNLLKNKINDDAISESYINDLNAQIRVLQNEKNEIGTKDQLLFYYII